MEILRESAHALTVDLLAALPRAGLALLVLLLALLAGRAVGMGLQRALRRGGLSDLHRTFFRRLAVWVSGLVGLLLALHVLGWGRAAASILAGGGITAVILGFAFREIGENFLAGFFLAFSRPFQVGDLIRSGDFEGVVRSIDLRTTHVRTADGRDIYIPSSQIFNRPLVNYTRDGLRRPSFVFGLDYRDDTAQARRILVAAMRGIPGILESPPPGAMVQDLQGSWVEILVFFWIDTFQGTDLAAVRSEAIEGCRRALLEGGYTVSSETVTNLSLQGDAPS